jgi:DNA invertase Pin-like site-specific DNA recombinase
MSAQLSQKGKCMSGPARVQLRAPDMQHAISILRVSTKKQLTGGDGIENQRRGNNEYIGRKRYRLLDEFVIAETADDKERVDFEGVINEIITRKKEIDVVVFWKVDRLSRGGVGNYYALKAFLAKHGVRIEFATEQIDATPAGELMESMLAATARFENRIRVDRTIGVEKILTKEGYWCRTAPTGFVNGRTENGKPILLPHPDRRQWDLLAYGLRKQLSGAFKVSEVAKDLAEKGLKSNKGNAVSKQGWTKICRSSVYGGLIRERWTNLEFVRAKFDGPITPDEWYRLQQVLDGRNTLARRLPRQEQHTDFPLRRFLQCPRCGESVRGYAAVKRNGSRFLYYDCRHPPCRFRVPVADAHKRFVEFLRDITPSRGLLDAFRKVVLEVWESEYRELNAHSNDLQQKVTSLRTEKRSLLDLIKVSAGNPALLAELQKDFERVDKELTLATMARNTVEVEELDAEAVVGACVNFVEKAVELWQEWPVELQNRLQAMVLPQGVRYDVLEGLSNPQLSPVYAAIENSTTMAAPRCPNTNYLLTEMIGWYKFLRETPLGEAAAC